jgi:hypothetical protein
LADRFDGTVEEHAVHLEVDQGLPDIGQPRNEPWACVVLCWKDEREDVRRCVGPAQFDLQRYFCSGSTPMFLPARTA